MLRFAAIMLQLCWFYVTINTKKKGATLSVTPLLSIKRTRNNGERKLYSFLNKFMLALANSLPSAIIRTFSALSIIFLNLAAFTIPISESGALLISLPFLIM